MEYREKKKLELFIRSLLENAFKVSYLSYESGYDENFAYIKPLCVVLRPNRIISIHFPFKIEREGRIWEYDEDTNLCENLEEIFHDVRDLVEKLDISLNDVEVNTGFKIKYEWLRFFKQDSQIIIDESVLKKFLRR
jgi:hypothetical protein